MIEFIEAADKFGADVIRWYPSSKDPYQNIFLVKKKLMKLDGNFI